jgi:hypothetical protein
VPTFAQLVLVLGFVVCNMASLLKKPSFLKAAHPLAKYCLPKLTNKVVEAFTRVDQRLVPTITVLVDPVMGDMDQMLQLGVDSVFDKKVCYVSRTDHIAPVLWANDKHIVLLDVPNFMDGNLHGQVTSLFKQVFKSKHAATIIRTPNAFHAWLLRDYKNAELIYDDTGDQMVHRDYVDIACAGLCTDEKTHRQLVDILAFSNSTYVTDRRVCEIDREGSDKEYGWNNDTSGIINETKFIACQAANLHAQMRAILAQPQS